MSVIDACFAVAAVAVTVVAVAIAAVAVVGCLGVAVEEAIEVLKTVRYYWRNR